MKFDRTHKTEFTLYASMCVVLSVYHRLFWPTNPNMGRIHILLFIALSIYFLLLAFSKKFYSLPGGSILIKLFFIFFLFVPVSIIYLRIIAFSIGTLSILSFKSAIFVISLLILFIILFVYSKLTSRSGISYRVPVATTLFLSAMCLFPIAVFLWPSSISPQTERLHPAVNLVIPPKPGIPFQTPYDLIYIPDRNLLVASFKMAGNHMLTTMNNPDANLIAFADINSGDIHYLSMSGYKLPECLDYSHNLLYVTRVGYGDHDISIIDIKNIQHPQVVSSVHSKYELNGIAVISDGKVIVTGIEGTVSELISSSQRNHSLKQIFQVPLSAGINVIDTYNPDRGESIFLSMIGTNVAKLNINSGEMKFAKVDFGGGQIAIGANGTSLFQTNIMFNSLNIINPETMKLVKSVRLSFKPRPVMADPQKNLLFIGAWLDGDIHIFNLSTLEEISSPVHVGRYLRNFAYDQNRGILYSTTMNGVYSVNMGKVLSQNIKQR